MPWPAIAIIGAGVLQQAMNSQAAADTNAANMEMNRENNDLQRYLANLKYYRDLEQWSRANAYNSPVAQKGRMLEAGLNPALHRIETGQATSSPEMAMPQTTAFRKDAPPPIDLQTPIMSAYNAYYQNQRTKAETDGILIDNQTKNLRNLASLNEVLSRTRGENARAAGQEMLNKTFERHNELDLELKRSNIERTKAEISLTSLKALQEHERLKVLPDSLKIELAKLKAEVNVQRALASKYNSDVDLNRKYIEHIDKQIEDLTEKTKGLKADNELKSEIKSFVIQKYRWDAVPDMDKKMMDEEHSSGSFRSYLYNGLRYANGALPRLRF